jgi:hypothetical protein
MAERNYAEIKLCVKLIFLKFISQIRVAAATIQKWEGGLIRLPFH